MSLSLSSRGETHWVSLEGGSMVLDVTAQDRRKHHPRARPDENSLHGPCPAIHRASSKILLCAQVAFRAQLECTSAGVKNSLA
jgi:hypothetical protein